MGFILKKITKWDKRMKENRINHWIIHMNKETCAENQKKLVFELRHLSVFFFGGA